MTASFQPTFKLGDSSECVPNNIRFPTFSEALEYADAMYMRTTSVVDYKILESGEPPTCTWAVAKAVLEALPLE